jgi:ubiquinone/menaquinone biosynthesis C-methylase UbiE
MQQMVNDNSFLVDRKTEHVCAMISSHYSRKIEQLLVVGCGSGLEAAILAKGLNTHVVGVDVDTNFDVRASALADLRQADARALPFPDGSFDVVYCYHALEHIPEPVRAIREIARVLRSGGSYFICTPNRSRLVGYLGGKLGTTTREKIQYNIKDWKDRLSGRFRNEFGAHAGFTSAELEQLIADSLPDPVDVSHQYYHALYGNHRNLLRIARQSGLYKLLYPSVYFMGTKPAASSPKIRKLA